VSPPSSLPQQAKANLILGLLHLVDAFPNCVGLARKVVNFEIGTATLPKEENAI
jgi:hypothetical protein